MGVPQRERRVPERFQCVIRVRRQVATLDSVGRFERDTVVEHRGVQMRHDEMLPDGIVLSRKWGCAQRVGQVQSYSLPPTTRKDGHMRTSRHQPQPSPFSGETA